MQHLVRYCVSLFAAIGITCSALPASADLAPPPGYVEECTFAKHQSAGSECLACSAYYGNDSHCMNMLGEYGFEKKCQSRGASAWGEIWCRPAKADAKAVPPNRLKLLSSPASPEAKEWVRRGPPPPSSGELDEPAPTSEPAPPPTSEPAPSEPEGSPAPGPAPLKPGKGGCACAVAEESDAARALSLGLSAAAIAFFFARRRSR